MYKMDFILNPIEKVNDTILVELDEFKVFVSMHYRRKTEEIKGEKLGEKLFKTRFELSNIDKSSGSDFWVYCKEKLDIFTGKYH